MKKRKNRGPTRAVALQWDGQSAPRVTAKGEDSVAEKILALAKKHNIPLQEDRELAAVLAQLELGEEIPERLYLAIAEVIACAYYLSGRVSVTATKSV